MHLNKKCQYQNSYREKNQQYQLKMIKKIFLDRSNFRLPIININNQDNINNYNIQNYKFDKFYLFIFIFN